MHASLIMHGHAYMIDGEKFILFTLHVSSFDHWPWTPVKVQEQVVMTDYVTDHS